jgi:Fe-S-cluster containining protein
VNLTRTEQDQALQAIYDQIPALPACDGRCWTTCGPIHMTTRERQRIRGAGTRITPWQEAVRQLPGFWCEALSGDKRCQVYELRPVVCRLMGAVESLPCPYGCQPDPAPLSDADGVRLLNEAALVSGDPDAIDSARLNMKLAAPDLAAAVTRMISDGSVIEQRNSRLVVPPAFRRQPR